MVELRKTDNYVHQYRLFLHRVGEARQVQGWCKRKLPTFPDLDRSFPSVDLAKRRVDSRPLALYSVLFRHTQRY